MTLDESHETIRRLDGELWLPPEAIYPPPDEDGHIRETFAFYGLAMAKVQQLEMGAINLLVMARIVNARPKAEEIVGNPWEPLLKETLGKLVRRLKPYLERDPQFVTDLEDALKIRNMLAHAYFNVRCEEVLSFAGRNQMLLELQGIHVRMESLADRLRKACEPYRRSAGYPDELEDALMEQTLREAADRDSARR
ncbi:hypothetical protein ACQEUV_05785 [Micromonospora aurantiaca (nom. illeg.)]|uniref:hypothetical protein n=1 Tax=Micromonospora aurantiaca (nom. illeg.) TaxID=47850 RepID=UPI003DA2DCD3